MSPREAAGAIALAGGCLVVGEALLAGIGLVRSRAEAVSIGGLALVVGWAVTGIGASLMLMAGLSVTTVEIALLWTLLAGAGAGARAFVAPAPGRPGAPAGTSRVAGAGRAVVVAYLAALLVRSLVPLGHLSNDAWTQWLTKAKIVYLLGGLDTGAAGWTQQANPDYPPLDPALEATTFHFMGRADFLALPLFHWIVFASFVAALAYLLHGRARPALVWPSLAMLVLAPKLSFLVGSSLADEPLALLVTLAGVSGVVWMLEGDPRLLGVAGTLLAAAALTKNEGSLLGLVLVLVLVAVSRRRIPLLLLAALIGANLPWRLWLHLHDVPGNFAYHWSRAVHPLALADHTPYLTYGARSLLAALFSPTEWLLILPAALAVGAIAAARRRPLGIFAVAFPLLAFAGFAGVYWLGNGVCTWAPAYACDGSWRDVEWLVANSADRIVASIALLSAALFPLVVEAAGALETRPATWTPARGRASAGAARALRRG